MCAPVGAREMRTVVFAKVGLPDRAGAGLFPTSAMKAADAEFSQPPGAAPRADAATTTTLALAGGLTVAFYALVWAHWRKNPDLSHTIFTLVLFAVLLHEARTRGPWRWLPTSPWTATASALVLASGVVLLVAGGLYAVALDWSNALVGFVLACALTLLLLAALLGLAGDRVRLVPINWPALAALALWPLSAPIPPGTYTRLTTSLQLWVTGVVLNALHFLGIPAMQIGNVITLARTEVGVEEACSGVRSLVACVVAGLFFSATLVRRPAARALLLLLAAPLALGMNVVRSLTLTLLANAGTDISGAWHEWTGFAVLGVTAALLGGLALLFETRAPAAAPPVAPPASRHRWSRWLLPSGLACVATLVAVFTLSTHGPRGAPDLTRAPELARLVLDKLSGWEHVTTDDLRRFTPTLETDKLIQRAYQRRTAVGVAQITLYVACSAPGQVPVSYVESHRVGLARVGCNNPRRAPRRSAWQDARCPRLSIWFSRMVRASRSTPGIGISTPGVPCSKLTHSRRISCSRSLGGTASSPRASSSSYASRATGRGTG